MVGPQGEQGPQSYFCRDCSHETATVMASIPLTEGSSYNFGPVAFLQGSGPSRTRTACQTMVQIVHVGN